MTQEFDIAGSNTAGLGRAHRTSTESAPPVKLSANPPLEHVEPQPLTHREILRVLSGLLMALFVSMMSGTIVANALPRIIGDLHGTQQQYTWVVTATLLASTAVTPIFGKLADLFDKKRLLLTGLAIFTAGSVLAGLATSAGMLIGFRVFQGIGLGAIQALVQITIASIITPRQRGRYNGYMGAVMATATVSGPLVGGLIVDTSWLGWRWCFWSAVPFALIAIGVLARYLHVPQIRRPQAKVDWGGAALISAGVSLLLLWVSFAGHSYDWWSVPTVIMVGGTLLITAAFIWVESKVREPIVPLWILRQRTTAAAIVASIAVGIAMFGASVFLGQYFQIGRGLSPTQAGLLNTPMMLGLLIASTLAGRFVSKWGRWKPFVVTGASLLAIGLALMGMIDVETPIWLICIFTAIAGIGLGSLMQNLVLAVQNTVQLKDIGAASSTITFFRSLGGAIGIQVLGAVFAHHVTGLMTTRLAKAHIPASPSKGTSTTLDLNSLPAPVADIIRSAYGDGIALVFWIAAAIAVIGILATLAMRATTLRDTLDRHPSPSQPAAKSAQ